MLQKHKNYILNNLNLESIIIKAMDKEEGLGWSFDNAMEVADEYRKYLLLCLQNEKSVVVPSSVIDDFWHLHILDTQKYAEDCERCFGYFLHHFPYFGMRGKQDEKNLKESWELTKELYIEEFGNLHVDIWSGCHKCPNCGRRITGNNTLKLTRPTFTDHRLNV